MSMTWIPTWSGVRFDLAEPKAEDVRLEDIAHGLALCNRFAGQTRWPYSVAQHSVLLARACAGDKPLARWALLHDAAEAYIGDFTRPLKDLLACERNNPDCPEPNLRAVESEILSVIAERFGLEGNEPPAAIGELDRRLLATEAIRLMRGKPLEEWEHLRGVVPLDVPWAIWGWAIAKREFLLEAAALGLAENTSAH